MTQRDKISFELQQIAIGGNKKINKKEVNRSDEDIFVIDSRICNLDEATQVLVGDTRQIVLFKEPYTDHVVSQHISNRKSDNAKLIALARQKNLYMFYAPVKVINGEDYVGYPHAIEWDSVPETRTAKPKHGLECPYCNKSMTSTPGRTLHVKSKHPEKYDEYMGGGPEESE